MDGYSYAPYLRPMDRKQYDYAIVGAGAAGLHLALKIAADPFFKDVNLLILEKDSKTSNDRTWSFWERGNSTWDHIAINTWSQGQFINRKETLTFPLSPYRYKTVRSADFYEYAKAEIKQASNIDWIADEVKGVEHQTIKGHRQTYFAQHIFDSRIPEAFKTRQGEYHSLIQHFRGWFIKTPHPCFDPSTFVMMDYRLKWKDSTSFTYVLPFSENYALVEFTLFNDRLIQLEEYETFIKEYLKEYLKIDEYEIVEIEEGIIPMSNYPFHQHHEKCLTKIGTAGGWVRPSSGYSFKNADRYSARMVENIKNGHRPEKGIATSRYRAYDSIFLNVLASRNELGEEIFTQLYTKPPIQSVFRFLDEESTLLEDFKIMFSLNGPPFWKAFLNNLF